MMGRKIFMPPVCEVLSGVWGGTRCPWLHFDYKRPRKPRKQK